MHPNLSFFGLGRAWLHYAKILKRYFPDFSPHLLVDINEASILRAREIFPESHCCHRDDYRLQEYLSSTDLGVVLTPSGDHYSSSRFLIDNGINVLCEKPSTLIPKQTLELQALAERNKLFYECVYQNRLNRAILFAKQIIDSGKIGSILNCDVNLLWSRSQDYYNDGWHGTWRMDGGVISQQAIHHIDAARFLCGEVSTVCGSGKNFANVLEAEDSFKAILQFQSGAFGSIFATTALANKDLQASITITGTNGQVAIGGICLNRIERLCFNDNSYDTYDLSQYEENVENGYGNGHKYILEILLRPDMAKSRDYTSYLFQQSIASKPSDSYKTIELVSALYSSWEDKKWVNVRPGKISSKLGIG